MARKAVTPPNNISIGPYSHAVEAGELLFLSGSTPFDPVTGHVAEGGVAAEAEQCFKNLFAVLEAAGLTPDDVVKVNVFLTNMSHFAAMNAVYSKQFNQPYPARTTVGVYSLPFGAQIEIEMVARRGPLKYRI